MTPEIDAVQMLGLFGLGVLAGLLIAFLAMPIILRSRHG